jgi:hypothetical protein
MTFAKFEQLDCADEIVLHELATAGLVTKAGKHAGVGSRINDPIHFWQRFQVARISNIAMDKSNPLGFETSPILFAPRPAEVVQTKRLQTLDVAWQLVSQHTANESADARDKNFHSTVACPRRVANPGRSDQSLMFAAGLR